MRKCSQIQISGKSVQMLHLITLKFNHYLTTILFVHTLISLANALHGSGLAGSSYARDKVREAIPRAENRTTGIKPY